jgi:hypothetical protein
MTAMLRVDKGTETGRHHGDINPHETVVYCCFSYDPHDETDRYAVFTSIRGQCW